MAFFKSLKDYVYTKYRAEEPNGSSQEQLPFLEKWTWEQPRAPLVWPWIASTFSLGSVVIYVLLHQVAHRESYCLPTTGPAYRTDLEDSHPHIVLEERTFSGKLWFDRETKTVYREIDPAEPQYFGPPGPEIDRAWGDLLRGEFVRLTPEEAAPYLPDLTVEPASGHYHFEPDMFHSLHCLNAVRKELDKDYYSKLGPSHLEMEIQNSTAFPPDWGRIHMDHCLDQLRQAIQCQGDLSPVPLYHHEGMSIGLGVGQTHTCRKWEPMRHWMDERKMRQLKDKAQ